MQIGEILKEARLEKGFSLEEVSQLTKIQIRHLKAIEENNFSMIPGNFYARVFIKEYANIVDLDFKALLDEHHHEIPTADQSVDLTQLSRSRKKSSSSKSSPFATILPTIIVFALLFGVVFFIWQTLQDRSKSPDVGEEVQTDQSIGDQVSIPSNGDDDQNQDDIDTGDADVQDEPEEIVEESDLSLVSYENAVSNYQFNTTDESIELAIESSGSNWLEVEDELGNRLYYDVLQASGSPVTFDISDQNFVYLRFGNPGDITIIVNDIEVELAEEMSLTTVQVLWLYLNEQPE